MTLPITVIIPCHNMANTLGGAIESALDAREIIVVDDASGDGADDFNIWNVNHDNVQMIVNNLQEMPRGVSATRNMAIEYADWELIVPLDADDVLLPNALQAMYDAYEENTLVYGGFMQDGVEYQAPAIEFIDRKNVTHATMLYSKADWQRVGGYPIRYNVGEEDHVFMLMLVKAGVKAKRLDIPLYVKGDTPNSRTKQVEKYHSVIREMMRIDGLIP